jgi:hypothetical protein
MEEAAPLAREATLDELTRLKGLDLAWSDLILASGPSAGGADSGEHWTFELYAPGEHLRIVSRAHVHRITGEVTVEVL